MYKSNFTIIDTSPRLVVEIGVLVCTLHNIHPSKLMDNAPGHSDPKIMEEIQRTNKQQKSARK